VSSETKRGSISAAGAVVWREHGGQVEFAIVHRPRYDDWSLPKGHAIDGESAVQTAVREVGEETGAHVQVSRRLGQVQYRVDGVDKMVRYWAMRAIGGEFSPNDEVDVVEWLGVESARNRLCYRSDRTMLDTFVARPAPTSVLIVVRHAKAGKRSEWDGTDALRPLVRAGRAQARAIAAFVGEFAPTRVLAADALRCVQTVTPLAERLDVEVEVEVAFADTVSASDPAATQTAFAGLIASGDVVAVCSQGTTIAVWLAGVGELGELGGLDHSVFGRAPITAKGAAWMLSCRDGQIVSADYYGAGDYREAGSSHPTIAGRAGRHRR
jgi:phosphohistidine phosphatase SixA/8-oxo-dGTP pyrophosphatase MutT (NUDIX family)